MKEIVVYSKHGCPLCDEAIEIIKDLQEEFPLQMKEIDIYVDDHLLEKYQLMIPVVEMDGEMIAYGKVDKNFIRKRLLKETVID